MIPLLGAKRKGEKMKKLTGAAPGERTEEVSCDTVMAASVDTGAADAKKAQQKYMSQ